MQSQEAAQGCQVFGLVKDRPHRDGEALDDVGGQHPRGRLDLEFVAGVVPDKVLLHRLGLGINDLVFSDAVHRVVLKLHAAIPCDSGGGNDLDNEIWDGEPERIWLESRALLG